MNENQQEKLGAWAIVELFGHTRIAGYVSEFVVGGAAFVRVDVPEVEGVPAFTRLFGPSAIYSITFVDEPTAKRAVGAIQPRPITIFIPTAPALPRRHVAEYEDVYARADSDFGYDEDEGEYDKDNGDPGNDDDEDEG